MSRVGSWTTEAGIFGKAAVIVGHWQPRFARELRDLGVSELILNYARGWAGDNLEFLRRADWVEALTVLDWRLKSDLPAQEMPRLRFLELSTHSKDAIDFALLPRLEELRLDWRPLGESLFRLERLRRLALGGYPSRDTKPFASLQHLEVLYLSNCSIEEVSGFAACPHLAELSIVFARRLQSLAGLEGCASLRSFAASNCPQLRNVDALARASSLERLDLDNDPKIASIRLLSSCAALRWLRLSGTTNVADGDLKFLNELPQLAEVHLRERSHYNVTRTSLRPLGSRG